MMSMKSGKMKISEKIVVHFTTKNALGSIETMGYIKPKNQLYPDSTGGDVDKVSAFKNFNYLNDKLIYEVKKKIGSAKSTNPFFSDILQAEDMVCLLIDMGKCIGEWFEYEKQTSEVFLMLGIDRKYEKEIGIYIKTKNSIPFSAIVKIV